MNGKYWIPVSLHLHNGEHMALMGVRQAAALKVRE
jgi:hypothetical protein